MKNPKVGTLVGGEYLPGERLTFVYLNFKCPKCKERVTIKLTPGPPLDTVAELVKDE